MLVIKATKQTTTNKLTKNLQELLKHTHTHTHKLSQIITTIKMETTQVSMKKENG